MKRCIAVPCRTPLAALLLALPLAAIASAATADEPTPEIQRPPAEAQAVGAVHTLRVIPEACARLEGRFTDDADEPYQLRVVASAPQCQRRALLSDHSAVEDDGGAGWILHDRIRVPSAACASQQAVLDVWRKPGNAQPPQLDAQGRMRVYLQDAKARAQSPEARQAMPRYAVRMGVEGAACR